MFIAETWKISFSNISICICHTMRYFGAIVSWAFVVLPAAGIIGRVSWKRFDFIQKWYENQLITLQPNYHTNDEGPIVFVANHGWLRGTIGTTKWTNQTYNRFLGVPYAEAPSGRRRFKVKLINSSSYKSIVRATAQSVCLTASCSD